MNKLGIIRIGNKHYSPKTENDVYIGRGSPLGNPYVIIKGLRTRDKVCDDYNIYFNQQMSIPNSKIRLEVERLLGLVKQGIDLQLMCFCAPHRCHGDIIKKYIEEKLIHL